MEALAGQHGPRAWAGAAHAAAANDARARPGERAGYGTAAQFSRPQGLAVSADETTLYVADGGNGRIRAVALAQDAHGTHSAREVGTVVGAAATLAAQADPQARARTCGPHRWTP